MYDVLGCGRIITALTGFLDDFNDHKYLCVSRSGGYHYSVFTFEHIKAQ